MPETPFDDTIPYPGEGPLDDYGEGVGAGFGLIQGNADDLIILRGLLRNPNLTGNKRRGIMAGIAKGEQAMADRAEALRQYKIQQRMDEKEAAKLFSAAYEMQGKLPDDLKKMMQQLPNKDSDQFKLVEAAQKQQIKDQFLEQVKSREKENGRER